MTNAENNPKNEPSRSEPFYIKKVMEPYIDPQSPNAEVAAELCKMLLKRQMNYLDMNEALYLADKVLHWMALQRRLNVPEDVR